jgi:hypothetical protein
MKEILEAVNIISALKVVSMLGTAGFGVLALLTEYKDKNTSRITKLGKIALVGIGFTAFLSITLHVLEINEAGDSTEKQSKQLEESSQKLTSVLASATAMTKNMEKALDSQKELMFYQEKLKEGIVRGHYPLEPVRIDLYT